MIPFNNYLVNQPKLQENIAGDQLKIGRSGYLPNIALIGKQTLSCGWSRQTISCRAR
ncbi:MAG: hypothetical protein ACLR6J_03095 [Parabacteroides merdae]